MFVFFLKRSHCSIEYIADVPDNVLDSQSSRARSNDHPLRRSDDIRAGFLGLCTRVARMRMARLTG
jgi:hypothetical protein